VGSRHGADGIRKYTHKQSILESRFALKKEPTMYPYKAGRTKQLGRLMKVMFKPRGR
jgi:hypothetical protein